MLVLGLIGRPKIRVLQLALKAVVQLRVRPVIQDPRAAVVRSFNNNLALRYAVNHLDSLWRMFL